MTNQKPVVVALPLDHQTDDLLATALDLGQRLGCPFVIVHALGKRRLESDPNSGNRIAKAKQTVGLRLQPLWNAGLDVRIIILKRPMIEGDLDGVACLLAH